jgi:branched-chain amino acid transport system substrate-binding protein
VESGPRHARDRSRAHAVVGTRVLRGAAALLCALAATGAATPAPVAPFTIDVIASSTGPGAFFGQQTIAGVKAYENAANAAGGIHGQPIHFEIHDDESQPRVAVELENAVLAKHPAIFLGGTVQATCNALGALAARSTVMYCLSPGLIPEPRSYVFAASLSLYHLVPALFRFVRTSGHQRVGLLVTTDATGQRSDQLIDYVFKLPEFKSLAIAGYEHFNDADISVSAQVARIKAADPQFLYVSAAGSPFQTVLHGILDGGLANIPIITSASNMTDRLLAPYAKTPPAQLLFNGPPFWGSASGGDPRLRAAIAEYRAAYQRLGAEETPNDDYGWDPAKIVVDALRHLGTSATAAQIHDYIESLHDFPGIGGMYDFRSGDNHGLGDDATIILQWDPVKSIFFPVSAPGGVAFRK